MKTNKKDSAFGLAAELSRSEDVYNPGLTKRELFAAMALQGMMADPNVENPITAASLAITAATCLCFSFSIFSLSRFSDGDSS